MRLLNHEMACRALSGVVIAACLTVMVGCAGTEEGKPATAAVPAASPTVALPSQVGKGLRAALDATVEARYGYGLSEANGKGQLKHVTPQQWKVCFQKPGPLSDSVIFGIVRSQESCPDRWIDKVK